MQSLPYCKVCFVPTRFQHACADCLVHFESLFRPLAFDVLNSQNGETFVRAGVFYYEGLMRRMLLRAKVQGDRIAAAFLAEFFLKSEAIQSLIEWAQVIVIAPSSLWGRIRGRIDLAYVLGYSLAKAYGIKLVSSPWQLYWRGKKRAKVAATHRKVNPDQGRLATLCEASWLRLCGPVLKGQRLLLIDDISTSGVTLIETALALKRASPEDIRMAVLATRRFS